MEESQFTHMAISGGECYDYQGLRSDAQFDVFPSIDANADRPIRKLWENFWTWPNHDDLAVYRSGQGLL